MLCSAGTVNTVRIFLWKLSRNYGAFPFDAQFLHHVVRKFSRRADALANRALDSGPDSRLYRRGFRDFFQDIAAQVDDDIYIQARFDGPFRRKCGRSAIGVCIEYVKRNDSRHLFDLGAEVACSDAY